MSGRRPKRNKTSSWPQGPDPRSGLPERQARSTLAPGAIVAGRFEVKRRVAAGGMGEVWVGEHTEIQMRVALKTLLPDACGNAELVLRFKREALLLGRMRSDHVARVLDFIVDGQYGPVLVMEFIEGSSLAEVLQSGAISVEEAIDLAIDVASALRELHAANIVHRDVKPGNIILQPIDDGRRRAIVVDFGLSRLVAARAGEVAGQSVTGITADEMALGTIEYMAPEQILRAREVTGAADLYALGAVLYRAVSGRHLFPGKGLDLARAKLTDDPSALDSGRQDPVARGLEAVVARAVERDPSNRYECADEMLADLCLLRDVARRALRLATIATAGPKPPRPLVESSAPSGSLSQRRSTAITPAPVSRPVHVAPARGFWTTAASSVLALAAAAALGATLARSARLPARPAGAALVERAEVACVFSPAAPIVAAASAAKPTPPYVLATAPAPPSPTRHTAAPARAFDAKAALVRAFERSVGEADMRADLHAPDARLSASDRYARDPVTATEQ